LPAFDPWVLGPGTDHPRVVPPARRARVSKQAGWIAPVVVSDGVVRGTWELDESRVQIAWFREAGRPPRASLEAEVERLGALVGRTLKGLITSA
jgi:hypothetical protein